MRRFFNIFILLLFSFVAIGETTYKPLKNVSFTKYSSLSFETSDITTECSFQAQNEFSSGDKVCRLIQGISGVFYSFAAERKYSFGECGLNSSVEVFEVSYSVLNDRDRFSVWHGKYPEAYPIWGLYDPRADEIGQSAIMIISQGPRNDDVLIAHEVAHFWYDRICIGQYDVGSEQVARDFEEYYKDWKIK